MIPKHKIEYEVVWHGAKVSAYGEKGSLLPPTHSVGSTWSPSVEKLRRAVERASAKDKEVG